MVEELARNVLTMLSHLSDFLHNEETLPFKWQTLLGSLAGPILAIYVATNIQSRKDVGENIRRVEVSLSGILNDIYESKEVLSDFVGRLDQFIQDIESDNNSYFVGRINFPNKKVFLGEQLSNFRLHSLYLHNKLLWIEGGVRNIDVSLNEMHDSFTSILEDSKNNTARMNAKSQRSLLAQEFRGFQNWVRSLIEYYDSGIKILVQAKVYNLMLKEEGRSKTIRKYEKLPIKYIFKSKEFKKHYTSIFGMQERIDRLIAPKVQELLDEAQRRLQERVTR